MWLIIKGIGQETIRFFVLSSPYLLVGFFLSGFFYVYFSKERVFKYLGGSNWRSVIKAALFGIPLPLCSCGVIPTALSLRRQGASTGATLSFLISTPETGVDSISITYALLDPIFTIFRPLAAFLTAITTGIIANFFPEEPARQVNNNNCHICGLFLDEGHCHSWLEKTAKMFSYAYGELLGDITNWLLFGFICAGAISYLIPEQFLQKYLGQGFLSMLLMLAIGIPLYVCATSTTPIAAALLLKGVNPGAVLVFLLSGPATNVATIMMVFRYLGQKAGIIYLSSIALMSLLMGYMLNYLYSFLNITPQAVIGHSSELFPESFNNIAAIILFILMSFALYRELLFHPACSNRNDCY